jgi:hypothetical protein
MNDEQNSKSKPETPADKQPHSEDGSGEKAPAAGVNGAFNFGYNQAEYEQLLGLLAWNDPSLWYDGSQPRKSSN